METRQRVATGVIAAVLLVMLFGGTFVNLYTDYLWFVHDVKYPQIFGRILALRWVLFLTAAIGFFLFALANLMIANRVAGAADAPTWQCAAGESCASRAPCAEAPTTC